MAELPRRFSPATLRLKELIATRLGAPKLVFAHRRIPAAPQAGSTVPSATQGSAELLELVDWCRYVVGCDPATVSSTRYGDDVSDDYRCLSLQFPGGTNPKGDVPPVTAQVSCGSYMPPQWSEAASFRPPAAMQVSCERGVAFVDLPSTLVWFDEAGRHVESLETESPVGQQLLSQFHRTVTSLVRSLGGLEDAFQAAAILAAAKESEDSGRRIELKS